MKCTDAKKSLSDFYDDELSPTMKEEVAEHIRSCKECAKQLQGVENLSGLVSLVAPNGAPAEIWSQIEKSLDRSENEEMTKATCNAPTPASKLPDWKSKRSLRIAVVAVLLIAAGSIWMVLPSMHSNGHHGKFDAQFAHYLQTFRDNPDAAQRSFLSLVKSTPVSPDEAIKQVGFRPLIANGLPDGYSVDSTRVVEMPCCTCTQSICTRSDGTKIAFFEHDDMSCSDDHCCLVEIEAQHASTLQRGNRLITMIGVTNQDEVDQLAAWIDTNQQPVIN